MAGGLLLAGCEDKLEEHRKRMAAEHAQVQAIAEAHRAKAGARLDQIETIAKGALAAPKVTERALTLDGELTLKTRLGAGGNVLLVRAESAAGGDTTIKIPRRMASDGGLGVLLEILDGGKAPSDMRPERAESSFEALESLPYLLVMRVHAYTPPSVQGADHFTPARLDADALLFDLETQKQVGALPLRLVQDGQAITNLRASDEGQSKSVESTFVSRVERALKDYLARR
ncbi:MAG: hypothetical protein NXI35_13355 [bacterium]|nr:hypothetical protein [bacterium]